MGTKPPTAVDESISKDRRHDSGAVSAALDQNVFPAREIGRFRFHAESDRGLRPILNLLFSSTAIPTHRLYCCSGALRALLSLGFCVPVCLHGKTWLPSAMLQACQTLFQYFRMFFEMIHHQLYLSICIRQRGFTRPEFFLLGDEAIALRDSPRETSALRTPLVY